MLLNLLRRGWGRRKACVPLPQAEVSCHGGGIGCSLLIHSCGIVVGWEYSGGPRRRSDEASQWVSLFPGSARGSVCLAKSRLPRLYPGPRPSCDPFEVFAFRGRHVPSAHVCVA